MAFIRSARSLILAALIQADTALYAVAVTLSVWQIAICLCAAGIYRMLTRYVRIKGKKLLFIYVPTDEPYYLSEEVECALWKKIMQNDAPDRCMSVAIGMSKSDRIKFAEYCSRLANEPLLVATAEQIVLAEQQQIIEPFQPNASKKRKKETTRSIQRKRKAVDKLSPWTELVGVRLSKPDDPILLHFKQADEESRPLRLVMRGEKGERREPTP